MTEIGPNLLWAIFILSITAGIVACRFANRPQTQNHEICRCNTGQITVDDLLGPDGTCGHLSKGGRR